MYFFNDPEGQNTYQFVSTDQQQEVKQVTRDLQNPPLKQTKLSDLKGINEDQTFNLCWRTLMQIKIEAFTIKQLLLN